MLDKKDLRKKFTDIRNNIDILKSKTLCENLMSCDEYINAKVIYTYISFRSEPDTCSFIEKALDSGKKICVPKCNPNENTMNFIEIKSANNDLFSGKYGIMEPISDIETALLPDLIIVPALSCDLSGTRLGYGGGYYDRFLSHISNVPVAALVYDELISDKLPKEETDIPVNMIITESRIYRIL